MLFRKIKKEIEKWIDDGKDALLITGARQVGKSYIIRETLNEKGKDFIEFNFIKQKKLISIFDAALDEDEVSFLENLRVAAKRTIKDDTIIFFDEIQECKEVVTIIKFLVEYGKYKYVLSGSLLGVELKDIRSVPVGYMTTLDMYPMDLEEFFIANGLGNDVLSNIKRCFDERKEVNPFVHDSLMNAFYRYVIVGGMPEAVQKYIDTGDFNEVSKIHRKIYRDYKMDFTKYEKENKLSLINTYDLIPSELNSKNKRYTFTDLGKELKFNRYENNFLWLNDAGVSLPTYNSTEFNVPLEASKKSNLFKLFLSDVGLLTTFYGSSTILKLLQKEKEINCGAMFENFVAQELTAHGFKLYYYNNKKHGELDFLIEYKGKVVPLEVKSGKDYQTHSALTYFVDTTFNEGIVLSNYNYSISDNIQYMPIYMTMFLYKDESIDVIDKIDLSTLSTDKTDRNNRKGQ